MRVPISASAQREQQRRGRADREIDGAPQAAS
jgi:hypothetical protein